MIKKYTSLLLLLILHSVLGMAQDMFKQTCLDDGWFFAPDNAKLLTNDAPYSRTFHSDKWQHVNLPHDWTVTKSAMPTNGVGWYRKWFVIGKEYANSQFKLKFDGISHSSEVWVNGIYCGRNDNDYLSPVYDITDCASPGDSVLVCVRVDASQKKMQPNEGAGICQHVWLSFTDPMSIKTNSMLLKYIVHLRRDNRLQATLTIQNNYSRAQHYFFESELINAEGEAIGMVRADCGYDVPNPQMEHTTKTNMVIKGQTHAWHPSDPYLYTYRTVIHYSDEGADIATPHESHDVKIGLRTLSFSKETGPMINGEKITVKEALLQPRKAFNSLAVTDEQYAEYVKKLQKEGFNTIHSSDPLPPVLLDICDQLGMMVIEEIQLTSSSEWSKQQLRQMIERDYNHPSIIAWSIGSKKREKENKEINTRIEKTLYEYITTIDSSRFIIGNYSPVTNLQSN